MPLNAVAREGRRSRTAHADPQPGPKRDQILRAAIDVFAERGYFNAQVADVARAAGVAAGTVYLYFRSKDDLLVSIFERSMREGLTLGREAVADLRDPRERLRRLARGFSSTLLRDYLGLIREAIADGQRDGLFRADIKATVAAKMLFGALDEMATNWILSRRRYSLENDAYAVVDLFINGVRPR